MTAADTIQDLQPIGDSIPAGAVQYFSQALAGIQPKTGFIEAGKEPWKSIINAVCKISVKDTAGRLKAFQEQVEKYGGNYQKISAQILKIDPSKPAPVARKTEWTRRELAEAEFPEPEWLIQDLILKGGVTNVSAKPKTGKTWLSMQAAASVASGFTMFGEDGKAVRQGKVIYYALEDSERRLKSRCDLQGIEIDVPIIFKRTITPLDKGGDKELRKVIDAESPALIVIDTFTPAHSRDLDEDNSAQISTVFNALRELANEKQVSFLINHHHKKGAMGDPREGARGSSAIGACVDIMAGIYKEHGRRVLRMVGNDIEDTDFVISFNDKVVYGWNIVGTVAECAFTQAEKEIIDILKEMEKATVQELARETKKERSTVLKTLERLMPDKVKQEKERNAKGRSCNVYRLIC